jgi:hypothetical protein
MDALSTFLLCLTVAALIYGLWMRVKPTVTVLIDEVEEAMEDGLTLDEVLDVAKDVAEAAEEIIEAVEDVKEEIDTLRGASTEELGKMLKADLIKHAEARGLDTSGLKADLVERLHAHLKA